MKGIILFFTLVIGGMIYLHHAVQEGKVLRYVDTHAQSAGVPEAAYYLGQGFYLFQNLGEATTYFIRVAERYPKHPLADDAYFYYMQCLDDSVSVPKSALIDGYKTYLERFPSGEHAEIVKTRISNYSTGSR